MKKYAKFKCNQCGKIVLRDDDKQWKKSFCMDNGCDSRLYRISGHIYEEGHQDDDV